MRRITALLLVSCLLFPGAGASAADNGHVTDYVLGEADIAAGLPDIQETFSEAPEVPVRSAILMEKETGRAITEKNADEKLSPASVTKIMTLLLVMEALDNGLLRYDEMVTVSDHAASMGGTQLFLQPGEQMSVDEMLKGVVIGSANDASVALAEHISGSEDAFVAKMNRRASELGMKNTEFKNSNGLDEDGHLTTARDIALMSRELIKHGKIKEYTTIWMDTVRGGAFGLANTNKLIRFYKGATGLKTGYTSKSKFCVSATAERDGMELISVVMAGDTSDERFSAAKTLLDYGFANFTLANIQPEEVLLPVKVKLGKIPEVQPEIQGGAKLLLEKEKLAGIEKRLEMTGEVEAPVEKGQILGELHVLSGGQELAVVPIVASEAVERLTIGGILQRMLSFLFGLG